MVRNLSFIIFEPLEALSVLNRTRAPSGCLWVEKGLRGGS